MLDRSVYTGTDEKYCEEVIRSFCHDLSGRFDFMSKKVMKNRFLDCISLYCPVPVLKTREALDKMEVGEVLELVADDPAAESDIQYLVKTTGQELLKMVREDQVIRFLIRKVK